MAEFSCPWPETSAPIVGDGRPYTAAEWDQIWEILFQQMTGASMAVLKGVWNALAVTSPGANQISVNTGAALGKGHLYWNDAPLALAPVSAPSGQTRQDSVILETDWTGGGSTEQYTTRIVLKAGTSVAPPAMTQVDDTLWQVRLYDYTIDDAGIVSGITDQRVYCAFATEILTAMCAAGMLSADAAGRAIMAAGYFGAGVAASGAHFANGFWTNALVAKFADGLFAANAASRAKFADGIWTNAKLASDARWDIGDVKFNAVATLGGTDGRRMVVGGVANESWVHCDGGAPVNGVTIFDYRNRTLAGASATNPAGTTAGADTANLQHSHAAGSYAGPSHRHSTGTLVVANCNQFQILQSGMDDSAAFSTHSHTLSGNTGYAGTDAVTGTSGNALSATQDMRQPTAYGYWFIYVG